MQLESRPHTLIRIRGVDALCSSDAIPLWVKNALHQAPWVVVRRARRVGGDIPVGVRGMARAERFAATIAARAAEVLVTPRAIAAGRLWKHAARARYIPAIAALDTIEEIMSLGGLEGRWGPGGSVGFELVSGCPAANEASDLDLVVHADAPFSTEESRALLASMARLPVRVDVLIEMPHGAVALADCLGLEDKRILRTADGPALIPAFTR